MFIFKKKRTLIWAITTIVMAVLILVVNLVTTQNKFIYNTLKLVLGSERAITADGTTDNVFIRDYESKEEVLAAANDFNVTVEEEGIILLKNDDYGPDKSLPLSKNTTVSVFGKNSVNMVYGGSGSSGSNSTDDLIDLYKALKDAGINYNTTLKSFYENSSKSGSGRPSNPAIGKLIAGFETGETHVSSIKSDSGVMSSLSDSSAAIVVISRIGGEGFDLPTTMATSFADIGKESAKVNGAKSVDSHYLELDANEEDTISFACEKFDNVIILLNTGTTMELGFLEKYDNINACLWVGYPGNTGCKAIGEVLVGDVNPSGRTTDTWIADFTKDPSWQNVSNNRANEGNSYLLNGSASGYYFVDYEEGIYVGYRYWETRAHYEGEEWYSENVIYPLGYGLSYSDFSWEIVNKPSTVLSVGSEDTITVEVKVTNNTERDGSDVVQLYYTAPYNAGGIEKAHVVLGDFKKISVPAKSSKTIPLNLKVEDMKSYDYSGIKVHNGGYILEEGDYGIKICRNAHEVVDEITYHIDSDIIIGKDSDTEVEVSNKFADVSSHLDYMTRNGWTNYPTTPTAEDRTVSQAFINSLTYSVNDTADDPYYTDEWCEQSAGNDLRLKDLIGVDYDDEENRWETLIDNLSLDEMAELIGTGAYKTMELVDVIGKPPVTDSDGPSGLVNFMAMANATVYDTCTYAAETVLGATWNVELAYKMGKMVGNEGLIGNERGDGLPYSGWYAPAVNIHRSPFGGRNWEYYSEDGLISGRMAAQVVKGCSEKGMYCFVKHFAVNDQETNRDSNGILVWLNEQALREIYLKPFEIAVKEGKTTAIMSSFNRIGTTWAGGNYNLLTGVLREEWGFKGMVITDYALVSYMNPNQMIRAGGDLCLTNDRSSELTSISTSTQLSLLRTATKNILYTVVNSNAMLVEVIGMRLPVWVEIMIVVDCVIVAALAAWGVWAILTTLKKMKSESSATQTANSDCTEQEG